MKYETFQLADIDLAKLKLTKENVFWDGNRDHSRWMFRTTKRSGLTDKRDLYFKIWNPTFIRRDNVLIGIERGFYDELTTPALVGPIFHKGICRGYVTKKCTKNWNLEMDEEFYRLIKKRSAETGYFHCQFSPYHMMRYMKAYTLIGLEGIYPFQALSWAKLSYKNYEAFIAGLCNHRINPHPQREVQYFSKSPLVIRGARFLWFKSRSLLLRPKMNQIHLIQR